MAEQTVPGQTASDHSAPEQTTPKKTVSQKPTAEAHGGHSSDAVEFDRYKRKLLREVLAMAEFAHEQCRPLSEQSEWKLKDLEQTLKTDPQGVGVQLLTSLHRDLCDAVAPAKPKSLLYLKEQKESSHSMFKWISPIGNIRYMIMASFFSLAAFVGISVSGFINSRTLTASFLELNFPEQLIVALFLLSAAGIGATYSNLYMAYSHVPKGTYDPDYNATYWVRFALGLTSGYILAELITLDWGAVSNGASGAVATAPQSGADGSGTAIDAKISKPLLALLGGFSASAVFRILTRLVEAVETIVQGDAKTQIEIRDTENMAKLQVAEMQRKAEYINQAVALKADLQEAGASTDQLKLVDELIQQTTRKIPPPAPSGNA